MARQIRTLKPGSHVTIKFLKGYGQAEELEKAIFLGLSEDKQTATFQAVDQPLVNGKPTQWDAYRYDGSWCVGSYAGRISLVSVEE